MLIESFQFQGTTGISQQEVHDRILGKMVDWLKTKIPD